MPFLDLSCKKGMVQTNPQMRNLTVPFPSSGFMPLSPHAWPRHALARASKDAPVANHTRVLPPVSSLHAEFFPLQPLDLGCAPAVLRQ